MDGDQNSLTLIPCQYDQNTIYKKLATQLAKSLFYYEKMYNILLTFIRFELQGLGVCVLLSNYSKTF